MGKRRGRPKQDGPRYPSGKLKPQPRPNDDPVSGTVIQRLFRDAKKLGIDERLASQVGRLLLLRELTAFQTAVAFRVASIYARFEREHGKRRSVRSPSYELSYGQGPIWDDLSDFGANAERDFFSLQMIIPGTWRATIEQLCVEDRAVSTLSLGHVRGVLEQVGESLGMKRPGSVPPGATSSSGRRGGLPLHFNVHEGEAGIPTTENPATKKPVRKPSVEELFWVETMQRLRPDLPRHELIEEYRFTTALKDRAVRDSHLAARRRPERVPASQRHPTKLGRPLLSLPPKASGE